MMPKDAVALIKADHRAVDQLFDEFHQAGPQAYKTKQRLVEQITTELKVHTKLEEELFYPAVRAKADADGKGQITESLEEHHLVDVLLEELSGMQPQDSRYDAKVQVLTENVRHHVQEEEDEMLPQAEQILGEERLQQLGEEWAARKDELTSG